MAAAVTAAKAVHVPVVMASKGATDNKAVISNNVLQVVATVLRVKAAVVLQVVATVLRVKAAVVLQVVAATAHHVQVVLALVATVLRVPVEDPVAALVVRVAVDVRAEGLVVLVVAHRKNCWSPKSS
jgi:hypothetical protein